MILALSRRVPAALGGDPESSGAPALHVAGQPFKVRCRGDRAARRRGQLRLAALRRGAFSLDGKPLG
jgi:hypothetical protein